jgi:uncharacterized protein YciI
MKQFVVRAYDGKGMLDKRMEVRTPSLGRHGENQTTVICAGGLLDDEGKMKGYMLVMEFKNRQELDEYLANEPYVQEHVWEKIEVEHINVVIR